MRAVLSAKVAGTIALAAITLYAVVIAPIAAFPIGMILVVSLLALHSIRDRDYSREPMNAAEADYLKAEVKRKTVQDLIEHLETADHMNDDCAPCPVPGLLASLKLDDPESQSQIPGNNNSSQPPSVGSSV